MAEISSVDSRLGVDYGARDYDSLLRSIRSRIPDLMAEWTDFEAEADFGNVLVQLFAHTGDLLNYYIDRVATEGLVGTAQTRRSVIQHLGLIGYRLATAVPAATTITLSFPVAANVKVVLRRGDAFASRSGPGIRSVRFEYNSEQPLEIDTNNLAVTNGRKVFGGIRVEEGRLIEDEFLGTSTGQPDQRLRLAHPRVILHPIGQQSAGARDVILRSDAGGVIDEWTLKETLAFSSATAKDVAIEIDENDRATLVLGDGRFAAVPAAGATLRATYRVGGGTVGNLQKDSIRTVLDAPQISSLGGDVTNPDPATGGAEREGIEHAVDHAPAVFRSLKRAVTTADYEALALMFGGVGKVRAGRGGWNLVRLYVAPEGGGRVSDVLRSSLLTYFEDLRPVSTLVSIEDVDYIPIFVTAEIGVISYYSQAQVVEQVGEAGRQLLAFDAVDFATTLYLSKFYEAIEAIPGVDFVNVTEFRRMGQPAGSIEASGKIAFADHEVPVASTELGYEGRIKVDPSGGFI